MAAAVTITAVTAIQGYKMLSSDGQLEQLTVAAPYSIYVIIACMNVHLYVTYTMHVQLFRKEN